MIKHFNTAITAGTTSGSKGGKGIGTIVLIALLAAGAYFGYRYLTRRNQPVAKVDED